MLGRVPCQRGVLVKDVLNTHTQTHGLLVRMCCLQWRSSSSVSHISFMLVNQGWQHCFEAFSLAAVWCVAVSCLCTSVNHGPPSSAGACRCNNQGAPYPLGPRCLYSRICISAAGAGDKINAL